MSAEGYQQAIENVAYEIDLLTETLLQAEGDDPFAAAAVLMSRDEPEMDEKIRKLDHIITVIGQTYHRTEEQVDRDINLAIMKRVLSQQHS